MSHATSRAAHPKAHAPWDRETAEAILLESAIGRQTLEVLAEPDAVALWAADEVRYRYQEKQAEDDPWPDAWHDHPIYAKVFPTENNQPIHVVMANDQINVVAVMTIIHEVMHVMQRRLVELLPSLDREQEAFEAEAGWVLQHPHYRELAPRRYQQWTAQGFVNKPAIWQFVSRTYQSSSLVRYEEVAQEETYPWGTLQPGDEKIYFGRYRHIDGWRPVPY